MQSLLQVQEGGLDDPQVIALLGTHLAVSRSNTPPESVHALDLSGLRAPGMRFWSAWKGGELLGCGALRRLPESEGEVKSMHTAAAARRQGVGTAVLRTVIGAARAAGMWRLRLETGSSSPYEAAVALYRAHGFVPCGPFGSYRADPNSRFMVLELPQEARP